MLQKDGAGKIYSPKSFTRSSVQHAIAVQLARKVKKHDAF